MTTPDEIVTEIQLAYTFTALADLPENETKRFVIAIDLHGLNLMTDVLDRETAVSFVANLRDDELTAYERTGDAGAFTGAVLANLLLMGEEGGLTPLESGWEHHQEAQRRDQTRCLDCGDHTMQDGLGEYYMVHDHIWQAVVTDAESRGMLCIGDLENRLGRQLTAADFTDAPINDPLPGHDSDRLIYRLLAGTDWQNHVFSLNPDFQAEMLAEATRIMSVRA